MLKIKGKFIQKGKFTATCPKCSETLTLENNGEVKEIKCSKCGYIFFKTNYANKNSHN